MTPRDSSLLKDLRVLMGFLAVRDEPKSADVIIGFGGDCPAIAHHIASLYNDGLAPYILFTGGRGRLTGRIKGSEAAYLKGIALKDGISEEAIFMEEESTSVRDNAKLVLRFPI